MTVRRAVAVACLGVGLAVGGTAGTIGASRAPVVAIATAAPRAWSIPSDLPTTAAVTPPGSTTTTLSVPGPADGSLGALFGGVLRIRAIGGSGLSIGTGFAVGDGSWVLTNHHVVEGATLLELETWDGRDAGPAQLVAVATGDVDLALIHLDTPAAPAYHVRADDPSPGEALVTAGYPEGRRLVRTEGLSLGMARSGGAKVLVTDLVCEPGCSGSPVLDPTGRVVGVIVGGTSEGQTLAIPMTYASALLRSQGVGA